MRDQFGRNIDYLRISITDLCNLRCVYCMPPEGVVKRCHSDILSLEEIQEIAQAAVELGVRKIRVTGGEPLVRRGVVDLCRRLGVIPGVEDLALTTNGLLLEEMAADLYAAGVHRVNISLDTLDAEKYHTITRGGRLSQALAGIQAAEAAGMSPIKINTVLIGGFNDDEISTLVELTRLHPWEVRFIELMPIGHTVPFGPEAYLPNRHVLERVPELVPGEIPSSGVATLYRLPDGIGRVGLISPLSNHFCGACNRLRLTADGHIKPCLHSSEEIPLRGLHGTQLREALVQAIQDKPSCHGELSCGSRSQSLRDMNQIGG